jgi:hypothetical protein
MPPCSQLGAVRSLLVLLCILCMCTLSHADCPGACIDTNSVSCWGSLQRGLCPGPANIVCCEGATPNCAGTCINKNYQPCNGNLTVGHCPGPSEVQCCSGGSPTPSHYNPAAAVAYADANCGDGVPPANCAAFVSAAIQAGGAGNPNFIWVHELVDFAKSNGWSDLGSDCCGPPGSIVVLLGGEHVCLSVGNGLVDCHNNNRCHTSGNYGPGYRQVFGPP